jgi:Carbohydrate-binding module 48 (Isoamylase N-terminal domain)
MITKSYSKTGRACRVTFKIPAEKAQAHTAAVLGEFNGWNADLHPMEKRKDGAFTATLTIEAGRPYRFRYLLDGRHWSNDESADETVSNQYGTEDSLLRLEAPAPAAAVSEPISTPKARAAKPVKPANSTRANGKPAAKNPAKPATRGAKAQPKPASSPEEAASPAPPTKASRAVRTPKRGEPKTM